MRIAWSCSGEGYGHAARIVALAGDVGRVSELEIFSPPSVRAYLRARMPGARLHWVPSFCFETVGHRVFHLRTLVRGLALFGKMPWIVLRLAKRLKRLGCQAVLSDFDPFLAWAGKLAGLPVIQFNHPGIVQKYPSLWPRNLAAICATRLMEGPYDKRILTSFYNAEVGPIIRRELRLASPRQGDYVVLNLKPGLLPLLAPALDACGLPYLVFPGREGYDKALSGCLAVISGGGHQTMAEAIFLGKPLLAIPQDGQYEQRLNALMLRRSGLGMSTSPKDFAADLGLFISRLGEFQKRAESHWAKEAGNAKAVGLILASLDSMVRAPRGYRPTKIPSVVKEARLSQ